MFICEKCAQKEGIDTFYFMLLTSYGPCEVCHNSAVCIDYHGYKQKAEKEAQHKEEK